MKKIAVLLLLSLLLSGCQATTAEPACRVVTGVHVQYHHEDSTITRNYIQPDSIHSVLFYLRLLRPFGPVIPEDTQNLTCRITLRYSHGPDSVYEQQGNHYLRRDDGHWKEINDTTAQLLYPLLLLLPSDV